MLNLNGVALRRGHRLLFENVSLQVQAGHRVGLVGANGSGKSSLFAAILGQIEVDHGEIILAAGTRIAHVAQASPSGSQPALEFVMDGDAELRDTQRAIAAAEKLGSGSGLHRLYERLERIDGFSAEARAARLLNGLGFASTDNCCWFPMTGISWTPCAPELLTSNINAYARTPEITVSSSGSAASSCRCSKTCSSGNKRRFGISSPTSTAFATKLPRPARHRAA